MQHHVNRLTLGDGLWRSGEEVCLDDGRIRCRLAPHAYHLLEAYECSPHLRFLKCKTDQDFVSFVRRWGPLDLTQRDIDCGISRKPLELYRILQRWLEAVVRLMDAYRNSDDDKGGECREWLPKFLSAEFALRRQENWKSSTQTELEFTMRGICGIREGEDTLSWIRSADLQMIRLAVEYVLRNTPLVLGVYLACGRRDRKPQVEAHWTVPTLQYALQWMVWYDVFNHHSLLFCHEEKCRKPFRAENAHRRKYCSEECAHRVAARKWRRKDLKEKRKQRKRERNSRGAANGTRKAR